MLKKGKSVALSPVKSLPGIPEWTWGNFYCIIIIIIIIIIITFSAVTLSHSLFRSMVNVSIEVEDVNDNSPEFINEPYATVITEVHIIAKIFETFMGFIQLA